MAQHGEPAFARASVMELWGLPYDSPKVDDAGFFKEVVTLLDYEHALCRVQILAAEAGFQCWSMSWYCSFLPGATPLTQPSIWNRAIYTAKANALYWGHMKVNGALRKVADDDREAPEIRQCAEELLVKFHSGDIPALQRQRREALQVLIATDPAYADKQRFMAA